MSYYLSLDLIFTLITRKTKMNVTTKIIGTTITNSVMACSSWVSNAKETSPTHISNITTISFMTDFIN